MRPPSTIHRRASAPLVALAALLAMAGGAQASVQQRTIPGAAHPGQAAGDCELVAAIDPAAGEAGSASITASVDQEITFWGSFVPGNQVELTFIHDGIPYGDFTPAIADAAGEILFLHRFSADEVGGWTVTAAVPATECAGTVEVTVTARSSNTTTGERSPESPLLTLGVALLLAASWLVATRRPARRG